MSYVVIPVILFFIASAVSFCCIAISAQISRHEGDDNGR